jgi:hypothetical protein
LPTFINYFGSILRNHFLNSSVSVLDAFAVTSLEFVNHPLKTLVSRKNKKSQVVTSPGNMAVAPNCQTAWQGNFSPPMTNVQEQCHAEETSYFVYIFFLLHP